MSIKIKKKLILICFLLLMISLAGLFLLNIKKDVKQEDVIEEVIETPLPTPTIEIIETPLPVIIDTESESSINKIVNKDNIISENYIPNDLVEVSVLSDGKQQLRQEANTAIEEMFNAAKESGINLKISSAYRSYKEQKSLWYTYEEKYGTKYANRLDATPGASEHQLGLAVDIVSGSKCNLKQCFDKTDAFNWLQENSYKYGYILRYPKDKENITKIIYSPWHFRYIGKDEALKVYESKLTLEEFYLN